MIEELDIIDRTNTKEILNNDIKILDLLEYPFDVTYSTKYELIEDTEDKFKKLKVIELKTKTSSTINYLSHRTIIKQLKSLLTIDDWDKISQQHDKLDGIYYELNKYYIDDK